MKNIFRKFSLSLVTLLIGILIGTLAKTYFIKKPDEVVRQKTKRPASVVTGAAGSVLMSDIDTSLVKIKVLAAEPVQEVLKINGKLTFDQTATLIVSSRVAGRVEKMLVFEGARVQKGQTVAYLYSPDWISAQSEFLLASQTAKTLAQTNNPGLINDAQITAQAARNKLLVLGASEEEIATVQRQQKVLPSMSIRTHISGVVSKRFLDPGAFLNMGDNLLTVTNTESLWFIGNLYEKDYKKIRVGQTVSLTAAALPDDHFEGTVDYIGASIDPATHTLPIRCTIKNPRALLKPEMFVRADVTTQIDSALFLPKSAFFIEDGKTYAIVLDGKRFQKVRITTGFESGNGVVVTQGLTTGQSVVVDGATLINAALAR